MNIYCICLRLCGLGYLKPSLLLSVCMDMCKLTKHQQQAHVDLQLALTCWETGPACVSTSTCSMTIRFARLLDRRYHASHKMHNCHCQRTSLSNSLGCVVGHLVAKIPIPNVRICCLNLEHLECLYFLIAFSALACGSKPWGSLSCLWSNHPNSWTSQRILGQRNVHEPTK